MNLSGTQTVVWPAIDAIEQLGIILVNLAEVELMPEEVGGCLPLASGEAGYLGLQCWVQTDCLHLPGQPKMLRQRHPDTNQRVFSSVLASADLGWLPAGRGRVLLRCCRGGSSAGILGVAECQSALGLAWVEVCICRTSGHTSCLEETGFSAWVLWYKSG